MTYALYCMHSRLFTPGSVSSRTHAAGLSVPAQIVTYRREDVHFTSLRHRNVVAYNGFFGVGAPEALLVGVVALVVFGPQGLIEAAKTVASTIRSVQPAIQELNQATTDIRTSITKEVGIDSLQKEFREIEQTTRDSLRLDTPSFTPPVPDPTPAVLTGNVDDSKGKEGGKEAEKHTDTGATEEGFTEEERKTLTAIAEEINKEPQAAVDGKSEAAGASDEGKGAFTGDEDIDQLRAQSAAMAWGNSNPPTLQAEESDAGAGKSVKKRLEDMTMAELQGELERRKQMIERIKDLH